MGGFFETEKMKKHVELCAVCKTAHPEGGDIQYMDCCDEYDEMFNNVIDFESGEGPWEDKPEDWLMCGECDGPVAPGKLCSACDALTERPQEPNDAFDDATCLLIHEIANGQRDAHDKGIREVARKMEETAEREAGVLPDVIVLLEVYRAVYPDVLYADARDKVLKASEIVSKGALNRIQDASWREEVRNQVAALVFGNELEQFGDFSGISFQWQWMRFLDEHPEAADLDMKTTGGLFARWMDTRFGQRGA